RRRDGRIRRSTGPRGRRPARHPCGARDQRRGRGAAARSAHRDRGRGGRSRRFRVDLRYWRGRPPPPPPSGGGTAPRAPPAYRLAAGALVVEDAGPLELKGIDGALRAWRVVDLLEGPARPQGPRAPLVGREAELELLENTFNRTLRDKRAHLFTIYGEPGVGKSRPQPP